MRKAIFLIDGGYLSFISRHFGNGRHIKNRIDKFCKRIAQEVNLEVERIYFYTAPPYQSSIPTKEENIKKANYDKFVELLRSTSLQVIVREGRCQKLDNGYHQKGVDTLITLDLFKIAQKSEVYNINDIIILTSDTDFVPIIEEIRKNYKIRVTLAYFTDKKRKSAFSLSNHLWKVCDNKILVNREHFGI